ncbi:MAG: hypothetical protein PUB42_01880 [Firmicutes bacterium]|nr:hypothetical protein [Bacillota bacterium]
MEVYGEKPKRFTKEWWEYFWDYYKWHTIGVAFVLFIIAITAVQCANKIDYDIIIDYVSEFYLTDEDTENLRNLVQENIDDVNGNGEKQAQIVYINMSEDLDAQMLAAMQAKLVAELSCTDSYLFLMSEKYADQLSEYEMFDKPSEWAGTAAGDSDTVCLANSAALETIGLNADKIYIGVRSLRDSDKDKKKEQIKHDTALKIAQYLVK